MNLTESLTISSGVRRSLRLYVVKITFHFQATDCTDMEMVYGHGNVRLMCPSVTFGVRLARRVPGG
jgi:hypothetical protein